jgi:hypothetical protein
MWASLSPEAAKTAEQAAARHRARQTAMRVTLARTSDKAIIQRPAWRDSAHQKACADWIKANLPEFKFNSRTNWWEAPLSMLVPAAEKLKADGLCNISTGAQEYIEEQSYGT